MNKEFDKYMSTGKFFNAIRSFTEEAKWGVLSLTTKLTRFDILREKYPEPGKAYLNYLVVNEHLISLPYHQSTFEELIASMVRKVCMNRHGSHGTSSLDANKWRRLLTSFKSSSTDLCKTIAKLAIRIATSHLTCLPYISCRLIALDKCPGIRPIEIEEVLGRIIGRTIVKCIKANLKILGGDQQLYRSKLNMPFNH